MSTSNSKNKDKNIKALFSVVCLCIVALGLIVYFSTTQKSKESTVNEPTTIVETTEVQHAVTAKETTTEATTKAQSTTKKQSEKELTMAKNKNNTPFKSYYKYPLTDAVSKGYSEELTYDKTMGDYRAHTAVERCTRRQGCCGKRRTCNQGVHRLDVRLVRGNRPRRQICGKVLRT